MCDAYQNIRLSLRLLSEKTLNPYFCTLYSDIHTPHLQIFSNLSNLAYLTVHWKKSERFQLRLMITLDYLARNPGKLIMGKDALSAMLE